MFEEATTLIEDKFRAEWTDTLIDWENVEFNPVRGQPFVRLIIEWTDNNTISVGGLDRGEGYTNISVFIPGNDGTENLSKMCDDLAVIFNKWDTGGLKFKVARKIRVGGYDEWYQVNLITPFTYDECNPIN